MRVHGSDPDGVNGCTVTRQPPDTAWRTRLRSRSPAFATFPQQGVSWRRPASRSRQALPPTTAIAAKREIGSQ